MRFDDLKLMPLLLQNVQAAGYETPTPIQQATIPLVLAGKDVLGCAQTGTGKTAAFALPIIQQLAKKPTRFGQSRGECPPPRRGCGDCLPRPPVGLDESGLCAFG